MEKGTPIHTVSSNSGLREYPHSSVILQKITASKGIRKSRNMYAHTHTQTHSLQCGSRSVFVYSPTEKSRDFILLLTQCCQVNLGSWKDAECVQFDSLNSLYLLELGIDILQVATSRIVLCFCVCIHFPLGDIGVSWLLTLITLERVNGLVIVITVVAIAENMETTPNLNYAAGVRYV